MKKLWILVAAIAIVSCKTETPDYALISGNISNADVKEMILYSATDRAFKDTITIAEDGTFNDTIKVAGEYFLYQVRNMAPLHVENGNDIKINFDSKDFNNTLAITGSGSEISNYLLSKKEKERELMGEGTTVYTKEEADYKKAMYSIKTAQEALLAASQGVSDTYKAKEKRNINYGYLGKLSQFKSYHSHYAKKPDYEPSAGFLSDLNNLDYNNEEDFKNFSSYKSLVSSHYRKKAMEIADEDDKYGSMAMLKVCGTIENQTIKNALLHDASVYNITYTAQLEKFYAAYKAAGSTDEKNNAEIEKSYTALRVLAKGNPSPKFVDYENYAGGTTSLDDLKGKYTYIDIWATWCGPCIAEIPSLKKVEKQFHGKKIQFLSISIDAKKDHQKWKDMIKEKELGGIQLFADNLWESKFVADYYVKGIPKFILLDPNGNIVTPNAPRPSDKKLVELFKELKI